MQGSSGQGPEAQTRCDDLQPASSLKKASTKRLPHLMSFSSRFCTASWAARRQSSGPSSTGGSCSARGGGESCTQMQAEHP